MNGGHAMTIPAEGYSLIGAIIGAVIAVATTFFAQRSQRVLELQRAKETRTQLAFKEKSEKVYALAVDLAAAAYSFLWVTWEAAHENLDQETLNMYWDEI